MRVCVRGPGGGGCVCVCVCGRGLWGGLGLCVLGLCVSAGGRTEEGCVCMRALCELGGLCVCMGGLYELGGGGGGAVRVYA